MVEWGEKEEKVVVEWGEKGGRMEKFMRKGGRMGRMERIVG